MKRFFTFGRSLGAAPPADDVPDWRAASPVAIERALMHACAKPSGGWAVLGASSEIGAPRRFVVAGRELVAWRGRAGLRVAPSECPHMGADLCDGRVDREGRVVCPWHGLALGDRPHGRWAPLPSHDDGVLSWVRLPELAGPNEPLTETPVGSARPARYLDAVVHAEARCEPRDVLANRLDPWHGVHFHPHSFLRLSVLSQDLEQITVRVVYRVLGPLGVEVDARFHCPDPRTIVMTIIAGEGVGSVIETHATPIAGDRTAVIEATLATSERLAFPAFARARRLLRPFIEARAARLWVDDIAYAERTYALRTRDQRSGSEAMKPRGGIE